MTCAPRFGGDLLTADAPAYDEARTVFNAMIDRRPAVIARCQGVSDVIAALRFARDNGLEVAVHGGGHSAPGYPVCEGGVMIDVSPMKGVRVDPEARTAWARAGLNWGELDRERQAFGLAVTGGRIPDTGVAGLTLGAGSGWIERKYGFTVDNLRSVELVTADGRLIVADRERRSSSGPSRAAAATSAWSRRSSSTARGRPDPVRRDDDVPRRARRGADGGVPRLHG